MGDYRGIGQGRRNLFSSTTNPLTQLLRRRMLHMNIVRFLNSIWRRKRLAKFGTLRRRREWVQTGR